MAIPLLAPVISAVSGVVSQWLTNRGEKSQAKHQRQLKQISGEIDLDHTSASDMRYSWKDEWLTLVFTTPITVVFYGAIANDQEIIARMVEGAQVLTSMPEWYQWALLGIVAASFGLRTFNHMIKK